ncbi:MAG: histidine triad nucleotide-binding protein [Acidobacteriota bacterium]|nr:histidine triad nucleotide-binding protein [Acidobacteriota bacterium]
MTDPTCIFCKIGTGEVPADKVYEDDLCVAFRDMEPLMPTHVLVIPKDHYRDVTDDVPPETLGHCLAVVRDITKREGLTGGFRLMVNTGDDASQSVRHFHIHILGGGRMPRPNDQDWGEFATNAHKLSPR